MLGRAIVSFIALIAGTTALASERGCPIEASTDLDSSRIVVAGGSITEIIYDLGAQSRIVAVDSTSNYPSEATELPQIGYVRALSTEGVLTLNPTLILGEHDMGPPEVLEQLQKTGIETVVLPEPFSADGVLDKVRCVAAALDLEGAGNQFAIELAKHNQPANAGTKTRRVAVLLGLRDGSPVGAGVDTSGDGLIAMAGGTNVLADFDGWKPLSIEALVAANPEVIVMPNRGVAMAGGLDGVLKHPAIKLTDAGKNARIIAMDGMSILGFGPRTLTAAAELSDRLYSDEG